MTNSFDIKIYDENHNDIELDNLLINFQIE
jgi:hypothetical protein